MAEPMMDFSAEAGGYDVEGVMAPPPAAGNQLEEPGSLHAQIDAFVSAEGGPALTRDEIVSRVTGMANQHLERQVRDGLSQPDAAEAVQTAGRAYDSLTSEAGKTGMSEALSGGDPLYKIDYREYVRNRQDAANFYSDAWIAKLDELTGKSADNPVDRWVAAAKLTGSFALNTFTPGTVFARLGQVIGTTFPDAPLVSDFLNVKPGENFNSVDAGYNKWVNAMRQYAYGLPPDKRQQWVNTLFRAAKDNGVLGTQDDTFGQYSLLHLIFDGIEDPNREVTNANLDVALDAAGFAAMFVPWGKMFSAVGSKLTAPLKTPKIAGLDMRGSIGGEFIPGSRTASAASQAAASGSQAIDDVIEGEFRTVRQLDGGPAAITGDIAPAAPTVRFGGEGPLRLPPPPDPGTPTIAPTSVASVAASTPEGSAKLVSSLTATDPEAAARRLGTTPPDIAGSLLAGRGGPLPPVGGAGEGAAAVPAGAPLAPTGRPFIPSQYIDPLDQIESMEQGVSRLQSMLSTRIIDQSNAFIDDGWQIATTIGRKGGLPFRDVAQAQRFAQHLPMPTQVVSNGRGVFLQAEQTHYWDLTDPGVAPNALADGWYRQAMTRFANPFGKGVNLTPQAQDISTEAAKRSDVVTTHLLNMLQPLRELKVGEQANLFRVLSSIEGRGTDETYTGFRALGLSEREARAGESYINTMQEAYRMEDALARGQAVSEGWLETTVNGADTFIRPSDVTAGQAIDVATGATVRIDTNLHRVYELIEPIGGVGRLVVPIRQARQHVRDLRLTGIIAPVPNYMPRIYQWPRYVEEFVDGQWVARYGAANEAQAMETIDVLRTVTNNALRSRPPTEAYGVGSGNLSEFRAKAQQGLLNTGHRRPSILTDLAGGTRLAPPADRINSLVQSAAGSQGVGLWARTEQQYLRNTWGEQFELATAEPVARPLFVPNQDMLAIGITGDQQYERALAIWNHVRSVTGTAPTLLDRWIVGRVRNILADAFFSTGSQRMATVGRELAGQTDKVSQVVKEIGFAGWLQGNPLRQIFIQIANIPLFFAQPGATMYGLTGGFFRDLMILQAATSPITRAGTSARFVTSIANLNERAALALAQRMGMTAQEARQLLADFRASGYFDLARGHGMDIGTLGETSMVGVRHVGRTIDKVRKILGALGFQPGVNAEARAGWLVARNAFRAERGRLPKSSEDFTVVNGMASRLQMHMNRGGVLPIQRGMLGAFFQFYSAQVKSLGRLLFLDSGFDKMTKARMFAYQFLTYGAAGYGLGNLLDYIEQKTGHKLPAAVKYATLQGIIGTMINSGFRAATGDAKGELDVSGQMSPVGQLKTQAEDAAMMMGSILGMNDSGLDSMPTNLAGVQFAGGMLKSAQFAYFVRGKLDMPAPEKVKMIAEDFLTRIPATNNWGRATMAYNLGVKYSAKGQAVVPVTPAEAVGAVAGFPSVDESNLRAAQRDYYGPMHMDEGAPEDNLRDMANETFRWMGPMLRRVADEQDVNVNDVWDTIQEHAITYKAGLSDSQQSIYFGHLGKLIGEMDILQSDKFVKALVQDVKDDSKGTLMFGEDARDYIARYPDFPGRDDAVKALDNLLDVSALIQGTERNAETK